MGYSPWGHKVSYTTEATEHMCIDKMIINKDLLYGTGNYTQYFVVNYKGREYEKECVCVCVCVYSLLAQMIKNLPAMQETQVQSLVGKIPWRSK